MNKIKPVFLVLLLLANLSLLAFFIWAIGYHPNQSGLDTLRRLTAIAFIAFSTNFVVTELRNNKRWPY